MKKNICIIAPSLGMGGNERHLSILANYFQENGIQVHYIIVYNVEKFFQLSENILFYEPKIKRKGTNRIWYNIRAFYFVRKTVKKIKPDIILSFGELLNSYLLVTLLFTPYPHIIADTGSPILKHSFHIRMLKAVFYPTVKGIIAQTQKAAEQKRKMLGENFNIQVIPNPARPINKYPDEIRGNTIVYIGRLHLEKGVDVLINTFAKIENKKDWKLVIAGSGIHEKIFREQVEELKMNDTIIFIGNVKDVDKLLAQSKVFAFASHGEGFPNALLEALCAGVPIVSFDCVAGPADMITDNENGFLVEYGNEKSFTEKLFYLISNEEERERMSKNAEKVYDLYKFDIIGKKYLSFLLSNCN